VGDWHIWEDNNVMHRVEMWCEIGDWIQLARDRARSLPKYCYKI
jgi:hypothetical protein